MDLRILGAGAGALLAVLCASPVGAAVILGGDGSVYQQASSRISSDGAHDFDSRSDSWSGAAHDLHVGLGAETFDGPNGSGVNTAIDAHWASALSGAIDVTHRGWQVEGTSPDVDIAVGLNGPEGQADWSYSFTALRDASFDLNAEFIGDGTDDTGLGHWDMLVSQDGAPPLVFNLLSQLNVGQDAHAQAGLSLLAGHTYSVFLISNESADFSPIFPLTAAETAHFTWQITPEGGVPEPATWALAMLGFGAAGAALRRRPTRALA